MTELSCPKQARCPGCPLGAEPYDRGLTRKELRVAEALGAYPELSPELLPARPASPTLAYRQRAKLVVDRRSIGLFERGSHRVLDVDGCRVLSPPLTRATDALRRLLPLAIYGADLRDTTQGVLLTLLTERHEALPQLEQVARALVANRVALSVAISTRPAGNLRLLSGEPRVVAGPSAVRYRFSADAPDAYATHGAFVQAHAAQANYVHSEIARGLRQQLGEPARLSVLELFAGSGSLALALAQLGYKVTAVEAYVPAIRLAEAAAREQNIELCAVAGDATRFLREAARSGARYDAIIVNPPRRGLDSELRVALAGCAPRAVAYLSCHPHTLARDLWHLRLLGLAVQRAEPLDMIPWSDAIEVLAWLAPASPPAPRVLFEDAGWLAVDKPPHQELTSSDAPPASLLSRVRRLPDCSLAVSVEHWGSNVSGVCWFAKTPDDAVGLQQALHASERELLVLTRGNLRKQGTITRHAAEQASRGARYKKRQNVGRHSLVSVLSEDPDEVGTLRDFASIGHPVLGDARHGDAASNEHVEHRHGLDRAFVHCQRSKLRSTAGDELDVSCELSPDLTRVLQSLSSD